jgi:hypothetical protein
MLDDSFLKSRRSCFRVAMVLAIVADALQILIFPLFAEEFLPSFIAELVPGLDLVPFWTLAVVNVYRKWKQVEQGVRVIDVEPLERKLPNR